MSWHVWCIVLSSSRKYINPSWRSLIEMNKNNIFSRIVMRSDSHRTTINLSSAFHSGEECWLCWLDSQLLCFSAAPGCGDIPSPAWLPGCRGGLHLPLPVPRLPAARPAGLVRLSGDQDKGLHLGGELAGLRVWRCVEMTACKTL